MRIAEEAVNENDAADHQTNGPEDLAQMLQFLLERGVLRFVGLEHLGDQADLGVHPGPRHQPLPSPVGNQGAHENGVLPVAQRDVLVEHDRRVLFDRHRFPRQGRLFDLQVHAFDQPHVRRDIVAGLQNDDVSDNELPGGNRLLLPVPDHLHVGCGHLLEGGDRLLGLRFLDNADDRVQRNDGGNGDGIDIFPQKERDDRRDDQDDDQKIVELVQKQFEEPRPRLFGKFVEAVCAQPVIRLPAAEPFIDMRLQFTDDIFDLPVMTLSIDHLRIPLCSKQ